jgi:phage shock protein B
MATSGVGLSVSVGVIMFVLLILVVIMLVPIAAIVLLLRLVFRGTSDGYRRSNPEEARIMQEIHRGLTRMEERIDALETIVLDREDVPGLER